MKLKHAYFQNMIKEIDEFREKLNWKSIENVDAMLIELKQYMFDATMTVKEWEEDSKNENN